jgi:hypothetical protein
MGRPRKNIEDKKKEILIEDSTQVDNSFEHLSEELPTLNEATHIESIDSINLMLKEEVQKIHVNEVNTMQRVQDTPANQLVTYVDQFGRQGRDKYSIVSYMIKNNPKIQIISYV